MSQGQQERHVLILEGERRRHLLLESQTYSIGRDKTNAIVIKDASVSRKHAMLVRVPDADNNGHTYRLLDGDFEGTPSGNGTFVNGKKTSSHTLQNGDRIRLGTTVKAKYKVTNVDVSLFPKEFQTAVQTHKIQANATNSKQTVLGEAIPEEMMRAMKEGSVNVPNSASLSTAQATMLETSDSPQKLGIFSFLRRLFGKKNDE